MNIEQKIRNNREAFDDRKMPEGSRERFEARLRKDAPSASMADTRGVSQQCGVSQQRGVSPRRWLTWTSIAAAAAVAVFVIVSGLKFDANDFNDITTSQVAENKAEDKLIEMRKIYDKRVDEAIYNLEEVMKNVDDSTKMQINTVIHDLMDMGDVFAELAPLSEDRQMAIVEQVYDNRLRTIELITDKIK